MFQFDVPTTTGVSRKQVHGILRAHHARFGWTGPHTETWDMFPREAVKTLERYGRADAIVEERNRHDTVQVMEPYIGDPMMMEADGFPARLMPHEAVYRKQSYNSPLFAGKVVHVHRALDKPEIIHSVTTYKNVLLGWVPTMVGSRSCLKRQRGVVDPGSLWDSGGYFIEKGVEKSIVPTDTRRQNRVFVFEGKRKKGFLLQGEIRPREAGRFRSTSTLYLMLKDNERIAVVLPFTRGMEMPLFGMFRVLGFRTVRQAALCVSTRGMLSGLTDVPESSPLWDPVMYNMVLAMMLGEEGQLSFKTNVTRDSIASDGAGTDVKEAARKQAVSRVPKFEDMSPEDIMDWFGKCTPLSTKGRDNVRILPTRGERVSTVKGLIKSEVFPHMGTEHRPATLELKARLLAYMVWRILSVQLGRAKPDRRSDYANKQVESAAWKLSLKLVQSVRASMRSTERMLVKCIKDEVVIDVDAILRKCSFTDAIGNAMSSGNFAADKATSNAPCVTRPLTRHVVFSWISELTRVDKDVPKDNKQTEPREMDPTGAYYRCPSNTSEGETCGIDTKFASTCMVTNGSKTRCMYRRILRRSVFRDNLVPVAALDLDERCKGVGFLYDAKGAEPDLKTRQRREWFDMELRGGEAVEVSEEEAARLLEEQEAEEEHAAHAMMAQDAYILSRATDQTRWLFINGQLAGVLLDGAAEAAETVRHMRRTGGISAFTGVYSSTVNSELYVSCEQGGLRRPVVRLAEGRTMAQAFEELEACCEEAKGSDAWGRMMRTGIIEYVDPLEERNMLVQESPLKTVAETGMRYTDLPTHVNLHPSTMLSVNVACIPGMNQNAASRNTFESCLQKGIVAVMLDSYLRTTSMEDLMLERPMVSTLQSDLLTPDLPFGINAGTAQMISDGSNQEDSTIMSLMAMQLGAYSTSIYRTVFDEISVNKTGGRVKSQRFQKSEPGMLGRKHMNYDKLDEDGLVPPGTVVTSDDVLIDKVVHVCDDSQEGVDRTRSISACNLQVRVLAHSSVAPPATRHSHEATHPTHRDRRLCTAPS